ncbi:MAG: aryl-sulfate sulfotransferase [candidate division WOR-3 bacterium]|nr:MAG: aryl-sulfate sulfotransferase [candidate division WOR-3 bacterium]
MSRPGRHPRHRLVECVVLCGSLVLLASPRPVDAQERTMGLIYHDSTRSYQGYTLFTPYYHVSYLIDNQGRLVHSWEAERHPALMCYLLPNGLLLRTETMDNEVFTAGGTGGRVKLMDWDGNVTWQFDYNTESVCTHHDVEYLPSGNILMIAWEYKTRQEALEAGRDPDKMDQDCLWPDHLIELDPTTDSIVWRWHLWDHLVQDFDSTRRNYGVVRDHPELVDINFIGESYHPDWVHTNSVAYNERLDQVVLSSRMFSEIWVIDHGTTTEEAAGHTGGRYGKGGDLLYRWGNPRTYGRGDSSDWVLVAQHDAAWIGDSLPGAGHVLLFNNGRYRVREYSSAEELALPVDSLGFYRLRPDSTFGPDTPSWMYADTSWFFSPYISGCQRLQNGNTLVCSGNQGTLFEVTPDSQVVWKYINPVTPEGPMTQGDSIPWSANSVFRALRYSPDYAAFEGRTLTPGDPVERYPPGVGHAVPQCLLQPLSVPSHVSSSSVLSFVTGNGHTRLAVYDCMGREVATLVDGVLPAGRHDLYWSTRGLASGSYFLKLTLGTATSTRPVVVTR